MSAKYFVLSSHPIVRKLTFTSTRVGKILMQQSAGTVKKFETEQEIIQCANDTEFCLASYLFSGNLSRIWRVSEQLEYGIVGINE